MKKITLLVATCLQVGMAVYAQKVTVAYKNATLKFVMDDLQIRSNKQFLYSDECLLYANRVTYSGTNVSLDTVLSHVFDRQPVTYILISKCIIVTPRDIRGRIIDEQGAPAEGVNVQGTVNHATTDKNGDFVLLNASCDSALYLSHISMISATVPVKGRTSITVTMIKRVDSLEPTLINTGYEQTPKEMAPASSTPISEEQLDRQISSNVIDKIEGRVAGMVFPQNRFPWTNQPFGYIRGQSTLHANTNPLIIMDNFPLQVDPSMINPNDIKSITILKDAAATSIWGARAGNGVIVLTTKNGSYNQPLRVEYTSDVTITEKPNLWYMPQLSSSEYIDMETARYKAGYYGLALAQNFGLRSPVIEILEQLRKKEISEEQKDLLFENLKKKDVRYEVNNLFYRPTVTHRQFLSIRGGTKNTTYYLSGGFDKQQISLVTAYKERLTSSGGIHIRLFKAFELSANGFFSFSNVHNDILAPGGLYPFSSLRDSTGNPAVVYADIGQSYKNSTSDWLQNWDYNPLQELREQTRIGKNNWARLTVNGTYNFLKNFKLKIIYQHDQGQDKVDDLKSTSSYAARHLQNSFATQKNGLADYIIPQGGISDFQRTEYVADRGRLQLNYDGFLSKNLQLTALAGIEGATFQTDTSAFRYYGFYADQPLLLDYLQEYKLSYDTSNRAYIPHPDKTTATYDHFASTYINAGVNFLGRYSLSLSARLDRSNLFGVKTNQKSIPLGSLGFKWDISEEPYYKFSTIPYLIFHATYGYSGNIDKFTTAYTSATSIQTPQSTSVWIINPANPILRWEKSGMFNLGIELADRGRYVELEFEYYRRNANYLMGPGKQNAITGTTSIWGNNSALKGHGFDMTLQTHHKAGKIQIDNLLLLSNATNKVSSYFNSNTDAGYFVDGRYLRPREGFPVYSVYAFRWAGLDTTGDPIGYANGKLSKDYTSIFKNSADSLVYKGSAVPTVFGSFCPTLKWKNWEFSFTIIGKFNYYFRRSSVNYFSPYSNVFMGLNDFSKRWQPGKENKTDVPSLKVLATGDRDIFYSFSEALIERGDHIRLKDIRLNYNLTSMVPMSWHIHSMMVYIYAANLGLIWSKNGKGIDPDYLTGPPTPRSITAGITCQF